MGIRGRPGYHRATVIGGGVIGISWTALFLAHGLEVTVCDPCVLGPADAPDQGGGWSGPAGPWKARGRPRRPEPGADMA